jgi:SNF2 family DNA or RNA helicase
LAVATRQLQKKRAWALTGTPLENHLDDLISILEFVAPGRFDRRTMIVGLRRLLAELQVRRRRRDVLPDLPPKIQTTVAIELAPRQRRSYERALREGRMRVEALGRDLRISHVLELLIRLKQICNFCPESGESAKLTDLRERLGTIFEGDEKALVFSQFVDPPWGVNQLQQELRVYQPVVLTGEVNDLARSAGLAAFERDPTRKLMLLSLRAAGVGLNLTAASYVFHFDRWWNPATESQAEDRTHRIGQLRSVQVYAYVCTDTIEERIEQVLEAKRNLFADIVDNEQLTGLGRLDLDLLLSLLR